MAAKIDGLVIEIGANTSSFKQSMRDVQNEAKGISKDLKTVSESLKLDPENVGKAADKLKLLKDQAENATKKVEVIKKAIEALNKEYDDKSSKEYTDQLHKLEAQLESATREQELANQKVKQFSENAGDAGKSAFSLGDAIKGNLISSAIKSGLQSVINLTKKLASALVQGAKNLANYGKEAIDLAADYHDALGYSEQVFESQSGNVQKWVDENTNALRINKSELLQNVNSFGALYRSFGIGSEKAAEMSESLVQLAVDLRSATGKDTQEIIQSLTSVLTGGYQAGYKYGIVINESMVKAKAATMGYSEELTQAQKEQVIFNLIMEQTAVSQGQAARESGNYKSQLDAMKVTFDNLKISIGEKLLPVVTDLITKANEFIQSEEGQKMLDTIVEKIGEIAGKVKEFVESGQLDEWVQKFKEELPGILEDLGDLAKIVGDLVQPILDVYRAIQGYKDLKEMDEAIKSSKKEVHAFADSVDVDMNTLRLAINGFAELNNLSLTEIYGNWNYYQPQIAEYMAATGSISEEMKDKVNTATGEMASKTQTDLDATAEAFQNGLTKAGNADTSGLQAKTAEVEGLGQRIRNALANFIDNSGIFKNAPGAEYAHRALGGPAAAGQIYQVNDDAARRKEFFIPYTNGYILNGNDTERIVNNNTNNSRTYGDTNVYITSTGANAAAIADEIGAAVNQRRRMAGTW